MVVFLWWRFFCWCFCGAVFVVGVFVVMFLWCFCGGVFVLVFLRWCFCGGVFVVGVFVVVWLCFCCDTFLNIVVDIMLLWSGIAGQPSFTKSCCYFIVYLVVN